MPAGPEPVYPWFEKLPFPLRNLFRLAEDVSYGYQQAKLAINDPDPKWAEPLARAFKRADDWIDRAEDRLFKVIDPQRHEQFHREFERTADGRWARKSAASSPAPAPVSNPSPQTPAASQVRAPQTDLGISPFGKPYKFDESAFATYEETVRGVNTWIAVFRRAATNFSDKGFYLDDHGRMYDAGHPFRFTIDDVRDRRWYLLGQDIRPSQCDLALADLTLEINHEIEERQEEDPPNVIRFPEPP